MGFDAIEKIRKAILELPHLMSPASTDAAEELEDIIEQQFANGVDPFGEPWAPLAASTLRRGRTPPPLTASEALRAVHVVPLQSAGIRVEFDEDYASFHQTGTDRMPKRQLAPDNQSEFDRSSWQRAITVGYSNAILKNGGWRTAGADVHEENPLAHAAE